MNARRQMETLRNLGVGLFITVEGGEAVGKTTLLQNLKSEFPDALFTREPGGTPEAEAIRQLILNPVHADKDFVRDNFGEIFLFYAARMDHCKHLIQPALDEGRMVICDRYYDSTYAYQCAGATQNLATTMRLLAHLNDFCIKPDMTLLLDVKDDNILKERLAKRYAETTKAGLDRNVVDFIEKRSAAYHERVREHFRELAESHKHRFEVVDASKVVAAVQNHCIQLIYNKVNETFVKAQKRARG